MEERGQIHQLQLVKTPRKWRSQSWGSLWIELETTPATCSTKRLLIWRRDTSEFLNIELFLLCQIQRIALKRTITAHFVEASFRPKAKANQTVEAEIGIFSDWARPKPWKSQCHTEEETGHVKTRCKSVPSWLQQRTHLDARPTPIDFTHIWSEFSYGEVSK